MRFAFKKCFRKPQNAFANRKHTFADTKTGSKHAQGLPNTGRARARRPIRVLFPASALYPVPNRSLDPGTALTFCVLVETAFFALQTESAAFPKRFRNSQRVFAPRNVLSPTPKRVFASRNVLSQTQNPLFGTVILCLCPTLRENHSIVQFQEITRENPVSRHLVRIP